jgi:hypothetical protein
MFKRGKREQQETDEQLREEQEAAEERMGIDPAEFGTELGDAEAAPWRRGIFWWLRPREVKEPPGTPPDEK